MATHSHRAEIRRSVWASQRHDSQASTALLYAESNQATTTLRFDTAYKRVQDCNLSLPQWRAAPFTMKPLISSFSSHGFHSRALAGHRGRAALDSQLCEVRHFRRASLVGHLVGQHRENKAADSTSVKKKNDGRQMEASNKQLTLQ